MQWHQGASYLISQRTFSSLLTMGDPVGRSLLQPMPKGQPIYTLPASRDRQSDARCERRQHAGLVCELEKTYMIVERKAVTLQVDAYSAGFCVIYKAEARAGGTTTCLRGSYGSDNVINSRHTCEVYLTIRHVITQSGPHRCRGSVVIPVELRLRARTGSRVALARRGFVALPFRPHVALEAAAEPISRAAASISSSMQRATHISIRGRADRHANCSIGGSPTVPGRCAGRGRRVARRRPRHRRERSAPLRASPIT
jgi:hypothetical protein